MDVSEGFTPLGSVPRVVFSAAMVLWLSVAGWTGGKVEVEEEIESFPARTRELATSQEREEWIWLARAVYSETKRPDEQELVAWVIRNRVETAYRGRDSYKRVILDPYQFSAFNPGSRKRRFYSALDTTTTREEWRQAMEIAKNVILADSTERPFPIDTRHFYSERSMPGYVNPDSGAVAPQWATQGTPVSLVSHRIDAKRFRFYRAVM